MVLVASIINQTLHIQAQVSQYPTSLIDHNKPKRNKTALATLFLLGLNIKFSQDAILDYESAAKAENSNMTQRVNGPRTKYRSSGRRGPDHTATNTTNMIRKPTRGCKAS